MMSQYEMLFADQGLDEVLTDIKFPQGSPLEIARARVWEGRAAQAEAAARGGKEPWATFIVALSRSNEKQSAKDLLLPLVVNDEIEARVRLWAYAALRNEGYAPSAPEASKVLGVVFEVPMEPGLDVLAAYVDGAVRFLGASGQLSVVEGNGKPGPTVAALLASAKPLLAVAPRARERPAKVPPPKQLRLTALSASGVHQVEVPWSAIEKGGPYEGLFAAATKLLAEVT